MTGSPESAQPGAGSPDPLARLVINTDGGSRGNPGPAAYGVSIRDAASGQVVAERAKYLGEVSNNVAEYSGLVAGIETALAINPQAFLEIRMDSRLVVQQMSGHWKIKHPDMRALAARAHTLLAGAHASFTWVPRAQNAAADRLANQAMDSRGEIVRDHPLPKPETAGPARKSGGLPQAVAPSPTRGRESGSPRGEQRTSGARPEATPHDAATPGDGAPPAPTPGDHAASASHRPARRPGPATRTARPTHPAGSRKPAPKPAQPPKPAEPVPAAAAPVAARDAESARLSEAMDHARGVRSGRARTWSVSQPTTLWLVRHAESDLTGRGTFCGANLPGPPLSQDGRAQAQAAARLVTELIERRVWPDVPKPGALLSSPTARASETALALAGATGLEPTPDYAFNEQDFGDWDGVSEAEIERGWPGAVRRWATDPDFRPPGGETLNEVTARVKAGIGGVVEAYPGSCVIIAAHTIAIRAALGVALGAPALAWMRFRIPPASLTALSFWPSGETEVLAQGLTYL